MALRACQRGLTNCYCNGVLKVRQLPVLDGYEAMRQIEALPDLAALPIAVSSIAITKA